MSTSNPMRAPAVEAVDSFESSAWGRLTRRINTETLAVTLLAAVTIGLLSVLAYSFTHALQTIACCNHL
jgi:hypothetical protein